MSSFRAFVDDITVFCFCLPAQEPDVILGKLYDPFQYARRTMPPILFCFGFWPAAAGARMRIF